MVEAPAGSWPPESDTSPSDGGANDYLLHRVRVEVAEALERRIDEVEADVWTAIRNQVPAYRAVASEPGTGDDIRASVGAVVRVFIDLIRQARSLSADEFAFMRTVGMRRAEQGLGIDDIDRAANTALRVGLRHLRTELKALGVTTATFDVAGEIADTLYDYISDFKEAAGDGIHEIWKRHVHDRAEERAEVIGQILDGALIDERSIREATAAFGHGLETPFTLLVVAPAGSDGPRSLTGPMSVLLRSQRRVLRGPVRSVPIPHATAIAHRDGHGPAGGFLREADEVASAWSLIIVAEPISHLDELPATYQWMCQLLATTIACSEPGTATIDELTPHWLVSGLPTDSGFLFARRILGSLLTCDEALRARLLRTVRSFLAGDGSIKDTAERLEIDRRTVERHLAEFEDLTGASVRAPTQLLLVQYALHLLDVRGHSFPPPGNDAWERKPPR